MIAVHGAKSRFDNVWIVVLLLAGLVGGVLGFTSSYFSNTNVLIGFCLVPFTLFVDDTRRNNFVYAGVVLFFCLLAFLYGVRIFYFFALAFYFLWVIELFVGRMNILILFLLVGMSPFFIQVITILGFPIRLTLSAHAGSLLELAGLDIKVQGNMMILDGAAFSVDDACMGLNMFVISVLMGVFMLAFQYRASGKRLRLFHTALFFVVVILMNLVANLVRIVVLVFFKIGPDNPAHEIVGIVCLIVYVVIPLHFLSARIIKKLGKDIVTARSHQNLTQFHKISACILSLLILIVGITLDRKHLSSNPRHAQVTFGNTTPERLENGISKISTGNLLIYVKPIPEFFSGEHTPLMCWGGSGYKISGIAIANVQGVPIYTGILTANGEALHTAWWYTNGEVNTISQLDWRMRMLRGEDKFSLVNVTAKDEKGLITSLNSMLTDNPIIITNEL